MTTTSLPDGLWQRNVSDAQTSSRHVGDRSSSRKKQPSLWQNHFEKQADKAAAEDVQARAEANGKVTNSCTSRPNRMEDGKVFMDRASLLDDLFEISHIRTIYHMFIAVLLIFCISTLAVDYLDQGRLVLEFDLLFFAFGKPLTVTWAWALMFVYTLLAPYYVLALWAALYHRLPSSKGLLSLGAALLLGALQACVLGVFPIYVVIHNQLPPASRFIVILEQIRFLMKSYSFMRETAPVVMRKRPKEGEAQWFPSLSSYLYFLFCPTLIYRESYPRNSHIRWNYVGVTMGMILACLFYGYFILVRLCVPAFTPMSQTLTKRTLVLAVFHSILPGIMLLLLCFFAFLHCWLNLFGELLRFADRMFYKDWWNSTSFANYYRTWNVVVHDWLFYYGYRDLLLLSNRKFRSAAMLSVFMVSAVVHEYAFTMGFGFFYPVMFFLFATFGAVFNFAINDKRASPVFNVIMWMALFVGQGVQVCLYCQEWYAQIHCPRTGNGFWELVTPRSWSCNYTQFKAGLVHGRRDEL